MKNITKGWGLADMSGVLVTFSMFTIFSLIYLRIFWTHRAYVRFVIMLTIFGTHYVNLFGSWYLYGWQYFTNRHTDIWLTNLFCLAVVYFVGEFLSRRLLRPSKDTVLYGTKFISDKQANRYNQKINRGISNIAAKIPIKELYEQSWIRPVFSRV